ncbi:hypothetical protein COB72_08645 [bacterium]|nr:MAG: hypothetical protein COB72_08645 [bacterium]
MDANSKMKLREQLDPIYQRIKASALKRGLSKQEAFDSGFHMVDWLDDLEAFYSFCQNPDSFSDDELETMLINFLIHVPNHLAAAAKIYADSPVSDIFGVGAIEADD